MNSEPLSDSKGVRFFRDLGTEKIRSSDPTQLPQVLVFSWDAESSKLADRLCSLQTLPAVVRSVTDVAIARSLVDLAKGRVVACVLLVSKIALRQRSFEEVVAACTGEITLHQDFRLFVVPVGGLTFDDLKASVAEESGRSNAFESLVESVHFPTNTTGTPYDSAVRLLQNYLDELPQFRNILNFEAWKSRWCSLLQWCFFVMILQMIVAAGAIALFGLKLVQSDFFPLLMFGLGQCLFCSILALLCLPTRIASGSLSRFILIVGPISMLKVFPGSVLLLHWQLLLAGFLTGSIVDIVRRTLVRERRKQCDVRLRHESDLPFQITGKRYSHFLSNGPLFPQRVQVFLSYSESSAWSAGVARDLHHELASLSVPVFFAPDSIAPGSSWRHRLREEIGICSVFIFLLDEVTASKEWPEAELAAALLQQSKSGLPAIIVLHPLGMSHETIQRHGSDYVRELLLSSLDADPSQLRVIEHVRGKERFLAETIAKRYHRQAVSVFPVYVAAVLELALMFVSVPLSIVGVLGSFVVWPAIATIEWYKFHGTEPVQWLAQHRLHFLSFLLVAYWAGFIARLAVGAWYELSYRPTVKQNHAGAAAGIRKFEVLLLIAICLILLPSSGAIGRVYALIACAFGIILGSFYIRGIFAGLELPSRYRPDVG